MAVGRRHPPPGLLHHSDRGSQYTSASYQALLRAHDVTVSMSRPGNCFDNAPTESFFRTLKVEIDEACVWPTRAAATCAIADFIERFYNTERLHSTLGYRTPVDFEARRAAA
jgi:transposase InsO family protein